MTVKRGDVVLVDDPFKAGGAEVRRARVIPNDRDHAQMTNTIVAQTSGNITRVHESTPGLIALVTELHCGLARDSALIATNRLTRKQREILGVLGSLSTTTMARVDKCLRSALEFA